MMSACYSCVCSGAHIAARSIELDLNDCAAQRPIGMCVVFEMSMRTTL